MINGFAGLSHILDVDSWPVIFYIADFIQDLLKQNPGKANLILDELQNMVAIDDFNSVIKKLMRYTKNLTGTNDYSNDEKGKLRATV